MGRQQLVAAVTMLVLLGILVASAMLGWRFLVGDADDGEPAANGSPSPSACAPEKLERGERVKTSQVRVSVYNAGTRSGLANTTLDTLLRRGFVAGEAGNAPKGTKVPGVEVWTTTKDDPRAQLVALQFGKKTPVKVVKEELGPGVDVIVGNRHRALVKAPRFVQVKAPKAEVCVSEE